MHLDILKVPHHGSDRNVDDSFFERVTADHYIISGDGEHGNPERETLEMIERARGTDDYTIYFTFTEDAHLREKNKKRKSALAKVKDWVRQKPANCSVVYRSQSEDGNSVSVNLLSEA
jgi:beta-lactamase superfamily II metal-dependent hydrolase